MVSGQNLIHPGAMAMVARKMTAMMISGMQQPMARPNFLCRPDRVSGIPIFLEILPFAPEIPRARFQENEKPNFLIESSCVQDALFTFFEEAQKTFPWTFWLFSAARE